MKSIKKILVVFMVISLLPMAALNSSALGSYDWSSFQQASNCVEVPSSVINTSTSLYTYDMMMTDIGELQGNSNYSSWLRVDYLGSDDFTNSSNTATEMGRKMPVIVIGPDSAPNRFLIVSSMHAREYLNTQLVLCQAEYMLYNLYTNHSVCIGSSDAETLRDLVARCQFYIMPMGNPDGTMLSMSGLDSLDDTGWTAQQITNKTDFLQTNLTQKDSSENLITIQQDMNDTVNSVSTEHDTNQTATNYTFWKTNINGVDVHYNFYDNYMQKWLGDSGFLSYHPEHTFAPKYRDYYVVSPESARETKSVADYCRVKNFNIAVSYHEVGGRDVDSNDVDIPDTEDGGSINWNYGFYNDFPNATERAARQAVCGNIGSALGSFMNYRNITDYNGPIGFTGWYLHMFPRSFSCVIETGMIDYFNGNTNAGQPTLAIDAAPLSIFQLKYDAVTATKTRHCIWDRQKLAPAYMAKYILGTDINRSSTRVPAAPRFLESDRYSCVSFNIPSDIGSSAITSKRLYESTDGVNYTNITSSATLKDADTYEILNLSAGKHYFKTSLLNSTGESSRSEPFSMYYFPGAEITSLTYNGGSASTIFSKSGNSGTIDDKCVIEKSNYSKENPLNFTLSSAIQASANSTTQFFSDPQCTVSVPASTTYTLDSSNHAINVYAKVTPSSGSPVYYRIILAHNLDKNNSISKILGSTAEIDGSGYEGEAANVPCPFTQISTTSNTIVKTNITPKSKFADVHLYSSSDYSASSEVTNGAYIAGRAAGSVNNFYVKSISERGDVFYGMIPISRTLATSDPASTELYKVAVTSGIQYLDNNSGTRYAPKEVVRSNLANRSQTLEADFAGQSGSTIYFYNSDWSAFIAGSTQYVLDSSNPEYTVRAKVVAANGSTTTYYIIKVRHTSYAG